MGKKSTASSSASGVAKSSKPTKPTTATKATAAGSSEVGENKKPAALQKKDKAKHLPEKGVAGGVAGKPSSSRKSSSSAAPVASKAETVAAAAMAAAASTKKNDGGEEKKKNTAKATKKEAEWKAGMGGEDEDEQLEDASLSDSEVDSSDEGEDSEADRAGVVYVGHIPRGLFEKQLKQFFGQFGEVRRLRLSRNPKTGASRGYAFVQFVYPEVAEIAARTANARPVLERVLRCSVLPVEKVHPHMFRPIKISSSRLQSRINDAERRAADRLADTEESLAKKHSRLLERNTSLEKRLRSLGVRYKCPPLVENLFDDESGCGDRHPSPSPDKKKKEPVVVEEMSEEDEEEEEEEEEVPKKPLKKKSKPSKK